MKNYRTKPWTFCAAKLQDKLQVCQKYEEEWVAGSPTNAVKYYQVNGQKVANDSTKKGLVFYHQDHLGSASVMSDSAGNVIQKMGYTPFGSLAYSVDGAESVVDPSTTGITNYTFTGQESDWEIGLLYYNARFYDPELGRFITADIYLDGMNRYAYCWNNPIMYTDPTGHSTAAALSIPAALQAEYDTAVVDQFNTNVQNAANSYSFVSGRQLIDALGHHDHSIDPDAFYSQDGTQVSQESMERYTVMMSVINGFGNEVGNEVGKVAAILGAGAKVLSNNVRMYEKLVAGQAIISDAQKIAIEYMKKGIYQTKDMMDDIARAEKDLRNIKNNMQSARTNGSKMKTGARIATGVAYAIMISDIAITWASDGEEAGIKRALRHATVTAIGTLAGNIAGFLAAPLGPAAPFIGAGVGILASWIASDYYERKGY